jgi:hypothetical protein
MGPWFSDEPQPFLPDSVEIKRVPSSPNNSSPVLHEFEIMATSSTNKGLDSLDFVCFAKFLKHAVLKFLWGFSQVFLD